MRLRRSDAAHPSPRAILAGSLFAAFNAMFVAAITSSGRPCSPSSRIRSKIPLGVALVLCITVPDFVAGAPW